MLPGRRRRPRVVQNLSARFVAATIAAPLWIGGLFATVVPLWDLGRERSAFPVSLFFFFFYLPVAAAVGRVVGLRLGSGAVPALGLGLGMLLGVIAVCLAWAHAANFDLVERPPATVVALSITLGAFVGGMTFKTRRWRDTGPRM
jgi:NAD/NADP transhydrogenase beta subunit